MCVMGQVKIYAVAGVEAEPEKKKGLSGGCIAMIVIGRTARFELSLADIQRSALVCREFVDDAELLHRQAP